MFFGQARIIGSADFSLAVVKGYLQFEGGSGRFFDGEWMDTNKTQPKFEIHFTNVFEGDLRFNDIRAEKPEHISFNKVRLCPSWFVNSDPRKFVFTDVNWENHLCKTHQIQHELEALSLRKYEKSHCVRLLTITFRNLASNAEEFNRFDDASNFRKAAFECELKEKTQIPKHTSIVHIIYRALSFYGESWVRAFTVLMSVILLFGLVYFSPLASFEAPSPKTSLSSEENNPVQIKMNLLEGVIYSTYIAALQKPDPKPADSTTQIIVIAETIFAPIQFALLALAIRRKFVR